MGLCALREKKIPPVSQNHRMFGVGRALCGSPSPTPLPKQGHPEQAAQHRVQGGKRPADTESSGLWFLLCDICPNVGTGTKFCIRCGFSARLP